MKFFITSLLLILSMDCASPSYSCASTEMTYLRSMEKSIKKVWDKGVIVLADRLLKKNDGFNRKQSATAEIFITPSGAIKKVLIVARSGYEPFDFTLVDALKTVSVPGKPSPKFISDDGYVHIFWTFNRYAPYSPLKGASIRYVKWKPEKAVRSYLSKRLFKKAWKRLIASVNGRAIPLNVLSSFMSTFFSVYYPYTSNPYFVSDIPMYLRTNGFPALIFAEYFNVLSSIEQKLFLENATGLEICNIAANMGSGDKKDFFLVSLKIIERNLPCKKHTVDRIVSRTGKISKLINMMRGSSTIIGNTLISEIKKYYSSYPLQTVQLLGSRPDSSFIPFLKDVIKGKSGIEVKSEAMNVMSKIRDKNAGLLLLSSMRNKDEKVKMAAMSRIVKYDGPDLEKIIKFSSWELGSIVKKGSTPELRKLAVRTMVLLTQKKLNASNKHYFFMMLRTKGDLLKSAVKALDPDVTLSRNQLMKFLTHSSRDIREEALISLKRSSTFNSEIYPEIKKPEYAKFPDIANAVALVSASSKTLIKKSITAKGYKKFSLLKAAAESDGKYYIEFINKAVSSTANPEKLSIEIFLALTALVSR
ncbi:MAG: hypothetical protein JXR95_12390 [Deltaproteobacteria bacterium]|nr:hypothetical protein [Deltaproteobacteria bacterium]